MDDRDMKDLGRRKMEVRREDLVQLSHNFVGGTNGHHLCVWECMDDYNNGSFPYEGDWDGRRMTEQEARKSAVRCRRSIVKKYGRGALAGA